MGANVKKFVALVLAIAAFGFVSAASAADMPVKAPVMVAPVYNWSGFYVGATAGYIWGSSQHCDLPACSSTFNVDGFTGGGTLGYNWQMANWVYGLETDFSGSAAKGSFPTVAGVYLCGGSGLCHSSLDWFGTVRGRVGYASNTWLPYITGGFAYGGLKASLGDGIPATTSATGTRGGWTLGAGVEYAIAPQHWSVKLEYLYMHLGNLFYDTAQVCGNLSCTSVHNNFNVVRLGVNYRF
jgi:outer membrane immunogenic protein